MVLGKEAFLRTNKF